jgi:acyl carrier protein
MQKQTAEHAPSQAEALLLPLWQDLLPGAVIDPEAELFDLGGDSLTLMQLLTAIEAATGVQVGLTQVFRRCSVRRVAGLIEQQQAEGHGNGA